MYPAAREITFVFNSSVSSFYFSQNLCCLCSSPGSDVRFCVQTTLCYYFVFIYDLDRSQPRTRWNQPQAHSFLFSSLTADVTFLLNVFYVLLLIGFGYKLYNYCLFKFGDSQKFEPNHIFIEAFTDKIDFDGNFIEDLLNKVFSRRYSLLKP